MLFEWVDVVNFLGVWDFAGVADAMIRLSKDFLEVELDLFGVDFMWEIGVLTSLLIWLWMSRKGLLIRAGVWHLIALTNGFFGVPQAEPFFGVFSQLFSRLCIFGEMIRRVTLSDNLTGDFGDSEFLRFVRTGFCFAWTRVFCCATGKRARGGVAYGMFGVRTFVSTSRARFTGVMASLSSWSLRLMAAILGELLSRKMYSVILIDLIHYSYCMVQY